MISEELVRKFETLTPIEVLERNKYEKATSHDLKILEELNDLGLNKGVINVLLEFVLLVNGMRLNGRLIKKIASHWLEYEVTTIEQAIIFSRKEHRQYRAWKRTYRRGNADKKWA
ncbi:MULTISPECIES: DnaD domain protein [Bacillaceae]|uniref:DnaD domain protein n=1 Tax=Bacillaceae TaxID=186817 RepID=UPI0016024483|nr:DnaD domain protein [Bacillus sp. PK3_68]